MAVLIVGGGKIGLEKISAILLHAPRTKITLVAPNICDEIRTLVAAHDLQLHERKFVPDDLTDMNVVMIAINDPEESGRIAALARERNKLVNVADRPAQCDFYMSSIVRKGNLKVAISTNGKSPTIAKRLKELFDEMLPEELDEILEQMQVIRERMQGDFAEKVSKLNLITRELANIEQRTRNRE